MTTMKQKVGDAIYDAIRAGNWTSATLADAALAALETPDEGMVEAGDDAIIEALNEHPPDVQFTKGTPAERCIKAAIRSIREATP